MTFLSAQSVNELKNYGRRYDIKQEISNKLGHNIKFKSKSWDDIYKIICTLNNLPKVLEAQKDDGLIVKIFKCKSKYELKDIGKFKILKDTINNLFENVIIIKANSWEKFYNSINNIKLICDLEDKNDEKNISNDLYFKGNAEKYIFFLIELDGKERLDKLGISRLHYSKKEVASKWRNNIAKVIHPDVCHHPNAERAMSELNDMYKEMIR